LDFIFYDFSIIYYDFQIFSQNKYKINIKKKHPEKQPERSYVCFEKIGEELCPVFSSRGKTDFCES